MSNGSLLFAAFHTPVSGVNLHHVPNRSVSFVLSHIGTSANMQVITAIYLNCRPDLRDEWLSGNEVDDLTEAQVTVRLRTAF